MPAKSGVTLSKYAFLLQIVFLIGVCRVQVWQKNKYGTCNAMTNYKCEAAKSHPPSARARRREGQVLNRHIAQVPKLRVLIVLKSDTTNGQ